MARLSVLAAAVSAIAIACSLNPQPIPPGAVPAGDGAMAPSGSADAARGSDIDPNTPKKDGGGGSSDAGFLEDSSTFPVQDAGADTSPPPTPDADAGDAEPDAPLEAGPDADSDAEVDQ